MNFFFAPMEGITKYPMRRVHHRFFPGMDAYYMPFIVANQTMHFKKKELADTAPENNAGIPAVPQVLTNKPDQFLHAARMLADLGYKEVNFNLGCPMATEVSKKKGAGFLAVPDALDRFFEEVFEGLESGAGEVRISVKTRIGVNDAAESGRLTEIFNRYPLSSLIIHARRRVDFYKGDPDLDTFEKMFNDSRHPVCYNGDINCQTDLDRLKERFPGLGSVMIGRGLVRDPALVRMLRGGDPLSNDELYRYLQSLYDAYHEVIHEDINVMHKMKEIWYYLGDRFPEGNKQLRKIRKARRPSDYEEAVKELLL